MNLTEDCSSLSSIRIVKLWEILCNRPSPYSNYNASYYQTNKYSLTYISIIQTTKRKDDS